MNTNRSPKLFLVLILALAFAITHPGLAQPAALTPHIVVLPGTTVRVGEEVLFDATGTTYTDGSGDFARARYEWDFGDGYVIKFADPYAQSADSGIAVSHFFMRPGAYTVTLTVSVWVEHDGEGLPVGTPVAVASTSTQVTVTGQPTRLPPWSSATTLLDMPLDGDLTNNAASGLAASWQGGPASFGPGKAGQAADLTGGSYLEVADPTGIFNGLGEFSISLWAKKNTPDARGYLIDKPGQFALSITEASNLVQVSLHTSDGDIRVNDYYNYEVDNTYWHHYAITYDGAALRVFVDGQERNPGGEAHTGTLADSTANLVIGKEESATEVFGGAIDEIRIYDSALLPKDISTPFELWHAPIHARIAQYMYAQIPSGAYSDPTNRLRVTISGDTGYSDTLVDKTNLASEEKFLLRNEILPSGNYTLTVQILDSGDAVLDQIQEKFAKPYDGQPCIGIDENNAINIEGQPVYVVTPWMLNDVDVPLWTRYINALYSEGYYETHTASTWEDYLDNAAGLGLYALGPTRWEGFGEQHFGRNSRIDKLAEYVQHVTDQSPCYPGLLAWNWDDEPNMGGRHQRIPSQVVSAWSYKSHQLDPQHPVATQLYGYPYLPYYTPPNVMQAPYEFLYNAEYFGGKKHFPADINGFDIYPLEFSDHPALNRPDRGLYDVYVEALDHLIEFNYGLLPTISFIEVVDVEDPETPGPTPDQLRMSMWLNVVHGMKGIGLFQFFGPREAENFGVMAEFMEQIDQLTPVILGPEPERAVTDNANTRGNRVDTMIREGEDGIYIFAVRLTEPDFEQQRDGQPLEAETIDVTFNVSGLLEDTTAIDIAAQSKMVWEHKGTPAGGRTFHFTLGQAPIQPGSLIVTGMRNASRMLKAFDNGDGTLHGEVNAAVSTGTVDYQTGQVNITFGDDVLPGADGVRVTYVPVRGERTVEVTNGQIQDTFGREEVHIYLIPYLHLEGHPLDNQSALLHWSLNTTLPATATWRLEYDGPGNPASPVSDTVPTRDRTINNLTPYTWYTFTLSAMVDETPILSDIARVLVTDRFVYLPVVLSE